MINSWGQCGQNKTSSLLASSINSLFTTTRIQHWMSPFRIKLRGILSICVFLFPYNFLFALFLFSFTLSSYTCVCVLWLLFFLLPFLSMTNNFMATATSQRKQQQLVFVSFSSLVPLWNYYFLLKREHFVCLCIVSIDERGYMRGDITISGWWK